MKLLAIDPGTFELGLYDGELSATLTVSKKSMTRPYRIAELGIKLVDFLTERGPYDFAVYEEPFARGNAATRALYGIVGVIECSVVNAGIGVMSAPQPTIFKWAREGTDVAKATKKGVRTRAERKALYHAVGALQALSQDVDLVTQDEHDAACIYAYIMAQGVFE